MQKERKLGTAWISKISKPTQRNLPTLKNPHLPNISKQFHHFNTKNFNTQPKGEIFIYAFIWYNIDTVIKKMKLILITKMP